jgi:evolutionarily conserved signaling intermediate in Toll pathway
MIRYRNNLVALLRCQVLKFQPVTYNRKVLYCTNKQNEPGKIEEEKFNQEKKRREEKQEFFEKRALIIKGAFEVNTSKDRNSFLEMIDIYIDKAPHRRNHVEFIYAALKNMEQYGVIKDLEIYKKLIDVMPKGKFIPTNMFQVEFQHYPKQQQCIIDLLHQMEDNGNDFNCCAIVSYNILFNFRCYPGL